MPDRPKTSRDRADLEGYDQTGGVDHGGTRGNAIVWQHTLDQDIAMGTHPLHKILGVTLLVSSLVHWGCGSDEAGRDDTADTQVADAADVDVSPNDVDATDTPEPMDTAEDLRADTGADLSPMDTVEDAAPDTDEDAAPDTDEDTPPMDADEDAPPMDVMEEADADPDVVMEECCEEGCWLDPDSGLCWEVLPGRDSLFWDDAIARCQGLTLGDSEDWYVPNLTELRTLVRGCPATEIGGACPLLDGSTFSDFEPACRGCDDGQGPGEGGCYWPSELAGSCQDYHWSSSEDAEDSDFVFPILFRDARISRGLKPFGNYVRCVRSF
jgi:hypothetical protein